MQRARAAEVMSVVSISTTLEDGAVNLALAEQQPSVVAAVGIHPCHVCEIAPPDWVDLLAEQSAHGRCVAVGETGLDFYHEPPEGWSREDYYGRQREVFTKHLELAERVGKPVVIHQRDRSGLGCYEEILRLMEPWHGRVRAVFHCWILPWELALPLVERGHVISFTGVATYPKAPEVLAAAVAAPVGTFMLETDSPYLPPVPFRGKRNEPAYVRHTAARIAEARGVTVPDLAVQTSTVAREFFSLR